MKNHWFVDGNKRPALGALRVTLVMNNLKLTALPAELASLVLGMATSDISLEPAEAWVRERTVALT